MGGYSGPGMPAPGPMTGAGTQPIQKEQVGPALLGKRKVIKSKKKEDEKKKNDKPKASGPAMLGTRGGW
jgi:hypothetical protein